MNFIQMCVAGTAKPEEIDKYVAEWHSAITALTAHEYLGMTWEEYASWAKDPEAINMIVESHKPEGYGFIVSQESISEDQQKQKECKNE